MTRTWTLGVSACPLLLVLLVLGVRVALGEPGIVTTLDGKTFEGEVTEKGDVVEVILKKGNIPVTIKKANVKSIEPAKSAEELFQQRMAKLKDDDAAGRVALARWAYDKGEYSLALDALDAAIAINPNDEDARSLKRTVQRQQELRRKTNRARQAADAGADAPAAAAGDEMPADEADAAPAEDAADADADAGADADGARAAAAEEEGARGAPRRVRRAAERDDDAGGGRAAKPGERRRPGKTRLVTPAEINRIRQLEWRQGDKVTVRFQNDVKRRYQESSEFTVQEFNKLTPQEQAYQILDNGSRRLHKDVIIATDPSALQQFKVNVQKVILPGCATAACHGGTQAGDFVLHNPAAKDPETYTNFLLLQKYKTVAKGDPAAKGAKADDDDADADEDAADKDDRADTGGTEYLMVDRTRPVDSLLSLYGLPESDHPHPDVPNFRPIFKGVRDPRYVAMIDWMGETLAPLAPEYGIDLEKPAKDDDSTTRPARGGARPASAEEPADGGDAGADDAARPARRGAN